MRKSSIALTCCAVSFALQGDAIAPPAIDQGSVVNAASRMPASLPAGSLARGSRFVIRGLRMGPSAHVRIAQGPSSVDVPIRTADEEAIEAVLPEDAPLGDAALTVVRDGKASRPYPIRIVASSLGLYTVNGRGWVRRGRDAAVSTSDAPLHPGSTVALWGTGLGNVSRATFASPRVGSPLPASPASTEDGLDRIEFRLGPETPAGCSVPVQAEASGIPTNVVTIAVAREGEKCSAAEPWFTKSHPGGRSAWVVLMRSKVRLELMPGKRVDFAIDSAMGSFHREPLRGEQPTTAFELIPPVGTCTTYSARLDMEALILPSLVRQSVSGRDLNLGPRVEAEAHSRQSLDAGASFTVTGPKGTQNRTLVRPPHVYTAVLGGNPPFTRVEPKPLFLVPGTYEVALAGGTRFGSGPDAIDVQRSINWSNEKETTALVRSRGLTVRWRAADKDSFVPIAAINVDRTDSVAGLRLPRARPRRPVRDPAAVPSQPAANAADRLRPGVGIRGAWRGPGERSRADSMEVDRLGLRVVRFDGWPHGPVRVIRRTAGLVLRAGYTRNVVLGAAGTDLHRDLLRASGGDVQRDTSVHLEYTGHSTRNSAVVLDLGRRLIVDSDRNRQCELRIGGCSDFTVDSLRYRLPFPCAVYHDDLAGLFRIGGRVQRVVVVVTRCPPRFRTGSP